MYIGHEMLYLELISVLNKLLCLAYVFCMNSDFYYIFPIYSITLCNMWVFSFFLYINKYSPNFYCEICCNLWEYIVFGPGEINIIILDICSAKCFFKGGQERTSLIISYPQFFFNLQNSERTVYLARNGTSERSVFSKNKESYTKQNSDFF